MFRYNITTLTCDGVGSNNFLFDIRQGTGDENRVGSEEIN